MINDDKITECEAVTNKKQIEGQKTQRHVGSKTQNKNDLREVQISIDDKNVVYILTKRQFTEKNDSNQSVQMNPLRNLALMTKHLLVETEDTSQMSSMYSLRWKNSCQQIKKTQHRGVLQSID